MLTPATRAILAASIFVTMPPREMIAAGGTGHGLDRRRDLVDLVEALSASPFAVPAARCRRPSTSESNTRQWAEIMLATRADEPVVVAVADIGCRHGVVLVDDGDGTVGEQRINRCGGR